jgi:hypothetical protein
MKKEILLGSMILFLLLAPLSKAAFAGGEMKEVCHKEMKKGKEVDVCKKIKVHKKLEGTKVPEKAPKK